MIYQTTIAGTTANLQCIAYVRPTMSRCEHGLWGKTKWFEAKLKIIEINRLFR